MVARAVREVDQVLGGRPISSLLHGPAATDQRAMVGIVPLLLLRFPPTEASRLDLSRYMPPQGIQRLIVRMGVGGHLTNPNAYACILAAGVKTSIQYGHTPYTPMLYAWYGWVGCAGRKRVR
jgi:hypothetical protein